MILQGKVKQMCTCGAIKPETMDASYLAVDRIHDIYYEVHGMAKGPTFIVVHGGPGAGMSRSDLTFFPLDKVQVVLFDQRACGKSRPLGELKNNTSWHLLEDIQKLILHLNLDKVYLFGGSWGSTLITLFSIQYPQLVSGIILRGFFDGSKEARTHFEFGEVPQVSPTIWNEYKAVVPLKHRGDVSAYYYNQILQGTNNDKETYSFHLCDYALALAQPNLSREERNQKVYASDFQTKARILSHYSVNDFFSTSQYIKDRIGILHQIPIHLVQGVDDAITPARFAKDLSRRLPTIKLVLVKGGHTSTDPSMHKALRQAVRELIA